MNKIKSKVIAVLCIAICVMAVGYAAFSTALTISGTANIASEWKVVFTKIEQVSKSDGVTIKTAPEASGTTATFDVGLSSPGDKIEYKITVENQGNLDAIIENIKATETGNEAIIFSIANIQTGDTLAGGESTEFNVTIEYDPNVVEQPDNLTNQLSITVNYVQNLGQTITPSVPEIEVIQPLYLASEILNNNVAYADNVASPYVTSETGIDFSAISSDTNGKGLYYTSTNTEDNKTTYYFRGAVDNNYVKFGKDSSGNDLYWRIVRINEDGSVRIIYNGTSVDATGDDVTIGTSVFNTNYNDNAYVGYMYGSAGASGDNAYNLTHSNDNPSTIKGVIDAWYEANLKDDYSSYLADAGFCNDRSVASTAKTWYSSDTALGYGTNRTYYGAYNRLYNEYQPQFACPNASSDLFTTGTSTKGNKALSNPIGLITADEVWYAGATTSSNNTYYLYTGSSCWTMSPRHFGGSYAYAWYVDSFGKLSNDNAHILELGSVAYGVRPAVNLQSSVTVTLEGTGDPGTSTNPYIIK